MFITNFSNSKRHAFEKAIAKHPEFGLYISIFALDAFDIVAPNHCSLHVHEHAQVKELAPFWDTYHKMLIELDIDPTGS